MRRVVVHALSAVVVVAGFLVVPLPLVEAAPGDATGVADLIAVEGVSEPINGELSLLTVRVRQPSIAGTLRALVSDRRTLEDASTALPQGVSRRRWSELQREEFRRAFDVAAAVGLRAAGLDVGIRTAPQVVAVMPGSPADGVLEIGDVIREFGGRALSSAEQLSNATIAAAPGDDLVLSVERGDATRRITVTAGRLPGIDRAGIGVTLQTLEEDVELPLDVDLLDQRGIGGPSAGLMTALAVYDLVTEEDLASGRVIAGTGTVDGAGAVGRIGWIAEKVLTAVEAGAQVLLVPASQADEARAAADGRIEVVGVDTVSAAIDALVSSA